MPVDYVNDLFFFCLEWGAKAGDLFGGIGIFILTLRMVIRDQNNRKDDLFWSNIRHKEEVLNRISFDKDNFGLKALKKYGEADLENRLKNIRHYVNFCEHIFENILSSENRSTSKYLPLVQSLFHQDELNILKKVVQIEPNSYRSIKKILVEIGIF